MTPLLDTVGDASDVVIYAMDETYVRLEFQNRRSLSLKGISPTLEINNSHIGVNIVGTIPIHGSFETFADIYNSNHSITNKEFCNFLIIYSKLIKIKKYI
ncbi:hypothetical protein [Clostridium beijerinckii]|uniref:Tc1-like transposase DDE domain-containing protein n=1 Tax=Clostridium beijerinckii TaxID=1520 RepID=A0AAE5LNQ2_CLOBE|nr:hypothetical protein [Clostridium beijerinckii]NSB12630.1 hypothetical protein [Clostridium beijerinckii]OOM29195.1 hypothetical protein CLOBE_23260 [Clostridium beijerinckii]